MKKQKEEKINIQVEEKTIRNKLFFKKKLKPELLADVKPSNKIPTEIIDSREFKKHFYGQNLKVYTYQYIKYIWAKDWNKHSALLIKMMLRNGKTTEFIVNPERPIFQYKDGFYIIDSDYLVEDISSGMYSCFYHQDISIPLKIGIQVSEVIDKINKNEDVRDVVRNVNPHTLKDVVVSTVIQKVIAGGQLEAQLNTLFYMIGASLLISFFTLMTIGYTLLR